jgi:7-cyano-7-deazaguanine reductase
MHGNSSLLSVLSFCPREDLVVDLAAELHCLCPVNGLEDHAMVRIRYRPSNAIVELGSFKAYLGSFAGRGVLHEEVTEEIQQALRETLEPDYLEVTTAWAPVEGVNVEIRTLVR